MNIILSDSEHPRSDLNFSIERKLREGGVGKFRTQNPA